MAFEPGVEGGAVDVDASTDLDERGGHAIGLSVENPPAQFRFRHKRRFGRQLLDGPQLRVVNQGNVPVLSVADEKIRDTFDMGARDPGCKTGGQSE